MKNEKAVKNFLKTKLATDKAWACRAVVKLYERQTLAEQSAQTTNEENGVGFTGTDAEFLSSIAIKLNKGWCMSEKQMTWIFKKVPKYWRQIWSMIPAEKQEELLTKL
jgi:hypothetical protein